MQPAPAPYATDGEFIRMADTEVAKRLEELKMFTRQTLNVEQRIEIARQQQAIREAKKLAKEELAKSKEKARHARELEKTERLEAQRKEREIRNQQAIEVRKQCESIYSKDFHLYLMHFSGHRQDAKSKKNKKNSNKKNFYGNNRYEAVCIKLHFLSYFFFNRFFSRSLALGFFLCT